MVRYDVALNTVGGQGFIVQSDPYFHAVYEHSGMGIAVAGGDCHTVLCANATYQRIVGRPETDIVGRSWEDFTHPGDRRLQLTLHSRAAQGEIDHYSLEKRYRRPDGSEVWAEVHVSWMQRENGAPSLTIAVVQDITERKAVERAHRASEEQYRRLFTGSPQPMWIVDRCSLRILQANDAAVRLAGQSRDALLSRRLGDLNLEVDTPGFIENIWSLPEDIQRSAQGRFQLADGQVTEVELSVHTVQWNENGAMLVLAQDITERKQYEAQLRHLALHDSLTGLPNRTLFTDRLEHALCAARRHDHELAVLYLDLDHFKEINDALGHLAGDQFLSQVAQRLSQQLRTSDTIARLHGDEFAVLLPDTGQAGAVHAAKKLLASLEAPLFIEDRPLYARCAIGIATYPGDGIDATTLLRRADVAMYLTKHTEMRYATYDVRRDPHTTKRLDLIADLRAAIRTEQLGLVYQPKVDVATGCAEHAEALLRWEHPIHGQIAPDQFIGIAEQTDLINPLTHWVIDEALRQTASWHANGLDMQVAVNLSPWNLQDEHLVDTVTASLERWGVKPSALLLEITETGLIVNPERALQTISRLHELGVQVSIDDFGTGYSSLAYLQRLPVDEVKIDRQFVLHMTEPDSSAATIVRSVIDLGHNLGLRVVAEGVETEQQFQLLRDLACDQVQGYLLSPPVSETQYVAWIREFMPSSREEVDQE